MTYDDLDDDPTPEDDGDDMACGPAGCNGACDNAGACWFSEVEDENDGWANEYEDAP